MNQLHEPGTLRTTAEFHILVDHYCVDDGKVFRAFIADESKGFVSLSKSQIGPELMARLQREYDEEMSKQKRDAEDPNP